MCCGAYVSLDQSREYGFGARFAHAQERRSRYVMIAGRGCHAISADMVGNVVTKVVTRYRAETGDLCGAVRIPR